MAWLSYLSKGANGSGAKISKAAECNKKKYKWAVLTVEEMLEEKKIKKKKDGNIHTVQKRPQSLRLFLMTTSVTASKTN